MAGRSKYDNPFEEGGADEVNPFAVSRKPAQAQLALALSSVRLSLPLLRLIASAYVSPRSIRPELLYYFLVAAPAAELDCFRDQTLCQVQLQWKRTIFFKKGKPRNSRERQEIRLMLAENRRSQTLYLCN
jgi:hypothetical protein